MPPKNPLESIRAPDPNVSSKPDAATKVDNLNAQAQAHKQQMEKAELNMGLAGKLLGASTNLPGNVAGILAILGLIAGVGLSIVPATRAQTAAIQSCFGTSIAALGYLFGVGTGRKNQK